MKRVFVRDWRLKTIAVHGEMTIGNPVEKVGLICYKICPCFSQSLTSFSPLLFTVVHTPLVDRHARTGVQGLLEIQDTHRPRTLR